MSFLSRLRCLEMATACILVSSFTLQSMEREKIEDTKKEEKESSMEEIKQLLHILRKERMRLERLYWTGHEKSADYAYALTCARRYELEDKASGIIYQFFRGLSFFHQYRADEDYAEAVHLFTTIANQTISPEMCAVAHFYLGLMYFYGKGVPRNNKVAQKYFDYVKNTNYSPFGRAASHYYLGSIYLQLPLTLQGSRDTASTEEPEEQIRKALLSYYTEHNSSQESTKMEIVPFKETIESLVAQDLALIMKQDELDVIDSFASSENDQLTRLLSSLKNSSKAEKAASPTIEIPDDDREDDTSFSLHEACTKGNLQQVQNYIRKKVNLNQLDAYGNTPLHCACLNGRLQVAQILLSQNEVNKKLINKDGNSAFLLACESGSRPLVEFLLTQAIESDKANRVGNTALHLASLKGHAGVVRFLLAQGLEKEAKNGEQRTPLLCAWKAKSAETMAALLEYGAQLINDVSGDSLFMAACKEGDNRIIQVILRNSQQQESLLTTTFFDACAAGHEKVIELLIKQRVDIDTRNNQGLTGLQLACAAKKENAILVLLKHQAKSEIDFREWACRSGCLELLKFSMESTKELDLSAGYLLLNYAASYPQIVEYILSLLSKNGITHSTLLFEACKKGNSAIIKLLAALNFPLDVIDEEGNTLLHCAPDGPMIQLLLAGGCKAEIKNKKGLTPLEIACMTGNRAKIMPFLGQVTLHHFWLEVHAAQIDVACFLANSRPELLAALRGQFVRKYSYYAEEREEASFIELCDSNACLGCLKSGKRVVFSRYSADVQSKALEASDYWSILLWAVRKKEVVNIYFPDNKETEIINLVVEKDYRGHSILYGTLRDAFKEFLVKMEDWHKNGKFRNSPCPRFAFDLIPDDPLRAILQ